MTYQNPPQQQQQWAPMYQTPANLPQSGFGVASFIMSLLVGVATIACVAIAGYVESTTPGGIDENSPKAVMIGLGIIACIGLAILGAVFGLVGVCSANKKKVFAILGLAFNGLIVLGVVGLMILGMAAG